MVEFPYCGRISNFNFDFSAKHSGRVLTLLPTTGTADLHAVFYGKSKSAADPMGASTSGANALPEVAGPAHPEASVDVSNDGPSSSSGAMAATPPSSVSAANPPPSETGGSGRGSRKILCVSTFQMCVLLQFNLREKMTYEEIKEETGIPDRELSRALQPLALGNYL